MANFVTPDKTASRKFEPGGIYFGTVTRVDETINRVYAKIPRFVSGFEFGPLAVVGPEFPVVGDRVACLFVENRTDDIVVIGVVKNQETLPTSFVVVATSTTRPTDEPVGTILFETDTGNVYIWNGTEWLAIFSESGVVDDSIVLGVDTSGNYVATITAGTGLTISSGSGTGEGSTPTIAVDSVQLGTNTTGNYVATITAGTNLSISSGSGVGEGSTPTLATSTTPSFSRVTSTVATGTAPFTVTSTTLVSNLNADLLDGQHATYWTPTGMLAPFAGATAPTGWLLCHGQSLPVASYGDLHDVIGYTYGGSGANFNLPDLRGRVIAGQDDMGGTSANRLTNQSGGLNGDTLGATGGAETHTLSTAQLPAHAHSLNSHTHTIDHTHTPAIRRVVGDFSNDATNLFIAGGSGVASTFGTTSISHSGSSGQATGDTGDAGSGSAHNNVQPTIILNYIIKT